MFIEFTRRYRCYSAGDRIRVSSSHGRALVALGKAIIAEPIAIVDPIEPVPDPAPPVIPEPVEEIIQPEAVTETVAMESPTPRRRPRSYNRRDVASASD